MIPVTETLWHATLAPDTASIAQVKPHVLACFDNRAHGLDATLACDEALTNIVAYAGATTVDVTIEREGHHVRVTFSDDGTPFDPVAYVPLERDFEDWDQGGMGINFMRQICREITYARIDGRNVLTLGL